MSHDWHDIDTARRWDLHAQDNNPCRPEQLDILVSALASFWRPGQWVLDLGSGSGQVEQLIFDRLPEARVVGVDGSAAMMALARERLSAQSARFEAIQHDLAALPAAALPVHPYHFVIAVQSLHHLSQPEMRAAYRWIHDRLEPGGLFLLLDRLRVEGAETFPVLRSVWERQDREYGSGVVEHEGRTFTDHARIVAARGDYPVLLQQHLQWLRDAGLGPVCLHLHGNRALLAGTKAG